MKFAHLALGFTQSCTRASSMTEHNPFCFVLIYLSRGTILRALTCLCEEGLVVFADHHGMHRLHLRLRHYIIEDSAVDFGKEPDVLTTCVMEGLCIDSQHFVHTSEPLNMPRSSVVRRLPRASVT